MNWILIKKSFSRYKTRMSNGHTENCAIEQTKPNQDRLSYSKLGIDYQDWSFSIQDLSRMIDCMDKAWIESLLTWHPVHFKIYKLSTKTSLSSEWSEVLASHPLCGLAPPLPKTIALFFSPPSFMCLSLSLLSLTSLFLG